MTAQLDYSGLEYKGGGVNGNGNKFERYFDADPDRSRYQWDWVPDWEQFDTSQDAWYFGVWVNKKTLQVRTYAEGDFTVVTCADKEAFNKEISSLIEFYEPGFIAKTISAEGTTTYVQDRDTFFIK